ncbi:MULTISPECIES: NAD-glutamate dehydrogenase [Dyella]|uniref:NAD-glutamate dehydrogenase n=2 Tax=Dyella TaxID=231454 RepID=A0A4R0Z0N4_9GAMM|nr:MULTISPECIES: NAD-glutamate dehydrogenase domain-containing protein [Dyella]TBR39722.1 NAD-glutamate dehydrogenase [Dyella terrae]TCI12696.1 NAD-glutamate dehydrogenase [Dyella soli]
MNAIRAASDNPIQAVVFEELKKTGFASQRLDEAQFFIGAFFSRIAHSDLELHTTAEWAALVGGLLDFMQQRQPGRALVRVINPEVGHSGRSLVQIVTDDTPFLVDTVSMVVSTKLQIHAVIHPVVKVSRDASGKLLKLADENGSPESVMHFEVDRMADDAEMAQLKSRIEAALEDVRAAVGDWERMRDKAQAIAADLVSRKLPLSETSVHEASEFLHWIADDNFTFLGYREYEVTQADGDEVLVSVEGSGLGILHKSERSVAPRSLRSLVASELPQSGSTDAIILTKTNARSHVHRPGHMDYIGVLKFDANGKPVAEQRFLGLFSSNAYMARPQDVPLVRHKVEAVLARSGLKRDSYSGKSLRHILETLPRDELFQSNEDELYAISMGILELRQRARTRLFMRRDRYGRFYSVQVFVPRERFNTTVRERIEGLLRDTLHGENVDSAVLMGEAALARLHIVVRPKIGDHVNFDTNALEQGVEAIVRNWHDDVRDALVDKLGAHDGVVLANRYSKALPAGYVDEVSPIAAAEDIHQLSLLKGDDAVRMSFYHPAQRPEELRFKVYRSGGDIALSEVLPQLENLGLRVLTEHVYDVKSEGAPLFIQDFEVQPVGNLAFTVEQVGSLFEHAFEQIWRGNAENDGFNRLVLGAKLNWRQIAMLRGYCKYLLQTGVAFSQSYMEDAFNRYPAIAGLLVELFLAKFDPSRESLNAEELKKAGLALQGEMRALIPEAVRTAQPALIDDLVASLAKSRNEQFAAIEETIGVLLESVSSLDDDRILRSFMSLMRGTLRTSFFQQWDGAFRPYISFKFDSHLVPELPKPVPYREIFVCAPRVEGIHLRFGAVARGGLRWSDRREDFRTEVLGLVKAQMVKNTVIVPVGSKGGFVVKRPPVAGDRDAQLAEGIACYRMFISGLLDITDNLVDGKVVAPHDVVRHDPDDPYLVVAADKGTATFSDIANAISVEHGFWLGDAFASGGSNGYDHKGMGITAKGAWESVKRHFRALGRDSQSQDFTCAGVGDMSGDVFGNGMLLSKHIRLVAAFDHRHVFLDPNPDAARSFIERERMFKVPRSSWDDYDKSLISAGGGVFSRSLKSIPITPEVRASLGLKTDVTHMAPMDLLNAILKAPVDLLWNGGIGTYVKASSESHADVGDRANNGLRVNGGELRCKIVGEGGNLGMTQKGRIEAAQHGVLLNTDFIDNSAGVDTSDHEVNIKILLNDAVQRGELTVEARNTQLAAMTDEVGQLVLWDNYRQNQAITLMERQSVRRLGSMAHFIRSLESEGLLDRQVENLPSEAELTERKTRGMGMTRPELSVLLSYDKIKLYQQLLDSDVPEDPYLSKELVRYFPEPLHDKYAAHMQRHRLKREIIATAVTNSTINRMGATFMMRMQEDTGQGPAAIAKAYTAAREILGARELWAEIEALDSKVAEETQIDAIMQIWSLLRHLTRWLLNRPGGTLDIAANVERYQAGVNALREALPDALTDTGRADFSTSQEKWDGLGLPSALAVRLARIPEMRAMLDIVEVAQQTGQPVARVAGVFYELGGVLDLEWLRNQIEALPVEGHWHAQARGSLLDELNHQHRALASQVLALSGDSKEQSPVQAWLQRDDATLKYTRAMLAEILTQNADYPIASVAVRRLAQLAAVPV